MTEHKTFCGGRVLVKQGDITLETTDAIVNAANSSLYGGGGVDGAIHRAGGDSILGECRKIRESLFPDGLPPGEAVVTSGGNLHATAVIHTVGPVFGEDNNADEILAACYLNSLRLAHEHKFESIAFPSISTGAFGFPRDRAAAISSSAVQEFVERISAPKFVSLVFFSDSDLIQFIDHNVFSA